MTGDKEVEAKEALKELIKDVIREELTAYVEHVKEPYGGGEYIKVSLYLGEEYEPFFTSHL